MANYLVGKLLVASPQMNDARFQDSVVFICGHDGKGAMGLVINKHLISLSFQELIDQLKLPCHVDANGINLYYGGPVELGRGFILHTEEYLHESSIRVAQDLVLTSNVDVLRLIAQGQGPRSYLIALGYSSWTDGQLEAEIKDNSWIIVDPDLDLVYSNYAHRKWLQALSKLGIDPDMLSSQSGSA